MNKWDYDLLIKLVKVSRPDLPKKYHTRKSIIDGRNCPARIIQKNVKMLLRKLPPETFIGKKGD